MSAESFDLSVLRALVGEASMSLDSARMLLDESRATSADLDDESLRGLWVVLEERVRNRRAIDHASILASSGAILTPSQRAALLGVLGRPELGVLAERLAILRERGARKAADAALMRALTALRARRPVSEVAALARDVGPILDGVRGRVREVTGDTMRILDAAQTAWQSGKPLSVATGWKDLDTEWRLVPNLHVIGAQPQVGKSALVAGLVRNWTAAGVRVGVLSYEDDAVDMQQRILACDTGLSLAHLDGDVQPPANMLDEVARATQRRIDLERWLIVDDTRPNGNIADVVASAREMHSRGARVLLLDNMTCVRLDGEDERHFELESALMKLREIATTLRIPVIVVGHLKRSQADGDETRKEPKLTDFAGAAAWERVSRSSVGMWKNGDGTSLRILKQTKGPSGGQFALEMRATAACVVGAKFQLPTSQDTTANRYGGAR